jgi:hypothetical protein
VGSAPPDAPGRSRRAPHRLAGVVRRGPRGGGHARHHPDPHLPARLAQLNDSNDKAQRHADALRSDAEIEKIAREQYGLVKPGEEAYHVLPPPQDPVEVPDVWPFNRFHKTLGK